MIHLEMLMVQPMADHSGLLMADLMDSQRELRMEPQRQSQLVQYSKLQMVVHSGLLMADLMDSQRELKMEPQRQWQLVQYSKLRMVIHLEMWMDLHLAWQMGLC